MNLEIEVIKKFAKLPIEEWRRIDRINEYSCKIGDIAEYYEIHLYKTPNGARAAITEVHEMGGSKVQTLQGEELNTLYAKVDEYMKNKEAKERQEFFKGVLSAIQ